MPVENYEKDIISTGLGDLIHACGGVDKAAYLPHPRRRSLSVWKSLWISSHTVKHWGSCTRDGSDEIYDYHPVVVIPENVIEPPSEDVGRLPLHSFISWRGWWMAGYICCYRTSIISLISLKWCSAELKNQGHWFSMLFVGCSILCVRMCCWLLYFDPGAPFSVQLPIYTDKEIHHKKCMVQPAPLYI